MSAPGKKNGVETDMSSYLSVKKGDLANSARNRPYTNKQEATSRFSSCTAKTSPSTDNNSTGNAQAQDYWDAALHAKIGQAKDLLRESDEGQSRHRACSDNVPSNQLADSSDSCSSSQRYDQIGEIKISDKSLQLATKTNAS